MKQSSKKNTSKGILYEIKDNFEPSWEHYRVLIDSAKLNIWEWDFSTNTLTDFGYFTALPLFNKAKEIPSNRDDFLAKIHPDDRENIAIKLEKSLNNYEDFNSEFRLQFVEGYEWIHLYGHTLRDDNHKPIKMIGTWRLISEEKKLKELVYLQQLTLYSLLKCNFANENKVDMNKILTESEHRALEMVWKKK
ncbi:MAG: PAS domain-containing protein [Tatlockia sp.]|nr:PAS domain-containing protein [Tatlockia sp.]